MAANSQRRIPARTAQSQEITTHATGAGPHTPEIIAYIGDMTAQLRDLAESRDLLLLSYLLDMAHQEARATDRAATAGKP